MQQTTKYKLNLIEPTDPFLPDGLNANTQKVEDALAAHEAAVGAVTDGLDARVTVLEGHNVVIGTFEGTRQVQSDPYIPVHVEVGFQPKIVVVFSLENNSVRTYFAADSLEENAIVWLAEDGFYVNGPLNSVFPSNTYLAFS